MGTASLPGPPPALLPPSPLPARSWRCRRAAAPPPPLGSAARRGLPARRRGAPAHAPANGVCGEGCSAGGLLESLPALRPLPGTCASRCSPVDAPAGAPLQPLLAWPLASAALRSSASASSCFVSAACTGEPGDGRALKGTWAAAKGPARTLQLALQLAPDAAPPPARVPVS